MEYQVKNSNRTLIKILRVAIVLIISFTVAGILIKMRPKPSRQTVKNLSPLVEVFEAKKTSSNMIIQAYGTVRSGENLRLTAEVKGKIVEMAPDFEEGVYLPRGSFLMRIDPRNYSLNEERFNSEIGRLDAELARITQERKNLQASLKIAAEDLRLAKAEYDRNISLGKRDVVSQNELDQTRQRWLTSRQRAQEVKNALSLIKPGIDLLQAQRQSALVQLREAQLSLERTEIQAPFDCRVTNKLVETGQYVTAGMALANIYNVSIMEVEVRLPPREVVWLHSASGGSVNLKGDRPAKARITFDAMGQKITWDGFVSRIKGHMEERTRTLPVVVEVENGYPGRGHPLMPGMFVSVEIQGKKVDDLFLIPQEAIHENETVHVVEEGKINVKQVNILRRMGNKVFVTEGLSDGDKVVTLFPGMATEGMKVRVRPRSDEGGSSG